MILLHKGTAQDSLLIDQYEARKTKLMGQLIDELVSPEIQSPQSFSLVQKIISKFYPSASQPDALDGDIKRLAEAI